MEHTNTKCTISIEHVRLINRLRQSQYQTSEIFAVLTEISGVVTVSEISVFKTLLKRWIAQEKFSSDSKNFTICKIYKFAESYRDQFVFQSLETLKKFSTLSFQEMLSEKIKKKMQFTQQASHPELQKIQNLWNAGHDDIFVSIIQKSNNNYEICAVSTEKEQLKQQIATGVLPENSKVCQLNLICNSQSIFLSENFEEEYTVNISYAD